MDAEQTTLVTLASDSYDVHDASRLERELKALQPGHNVVDCKNVRYIDSTTLTVFIRALKRLRQDDVDSTIALTNVSPIVRKIFGITSLDSVFEIR